jgi:intein/homing endonuclease
MNNMNTLNNVKKLEMNVGEQYSIKIGDLYDYINQEGGTFEILTPTGFEKIGDIYNKTNKKIYKLELENGLSLTGSEDHLVLL